MISVSHINIIDVCCRPECLLQLLTGTDPVYHVVVVPTKGRLEKRQSSRHTRQSSTGRRGGKQSPNDGRKRKQGNSAGQLPNYVDDTKLSFTHSDIANGLVAYQSIVPPTGTELVLNDKFTFYLTAKNAQPVMETVDIVIVSPPVEQTSPAGRLASVSGAGVQAVTKAADHAAGNNHVMIVVIVAVLTALIIIGLIIFKCVRRRRDTKQRKFEMAAVIDATSPVTSPASVPIAGGSNYQTPSPATAVAFSQPSTVVLPPETATATINSSGGGNRPPPMRSALSFPVPIIIEPPSSMADAPSRRAPDMQFQAPVTVPRASHTGPPRSTNTRSPTAHPGLEGQHPNTLPQRNGATGVGSVGRGTGRANGSKDQVTFDWQRVDPELLQHCRTTNPILHKNQYWV